MQASLVAGVIEGSAREQVLLLEHPPVYTLGRGADAADLCGAPQALGVPVHRVGRGGGATFHGPGQLVAYPVVRLRGGRLDVRRYVVALQRALVTTCAAFGLSAEAPADRIGAWVGGRKIASIGIGVRRGIAFHGVALNVSTDLTYLAPIVACRTAGLAFTSMAVELGGAAPTVARVGSQFARALAGQLGVDIEEAGSSWP
jgi:lipoate-protein ligase B